MFLDNLKNIKTQSYATHKNNLSSDKNVFSFSHKRNAFDGPRLKSTGTEETGYESSTDAGLFSDFDLIFNTTGNNIIDPSSITLSTSGTRIGWSYSQNMVTMVDEDSFVIQGTVTWGLGVQGATIGYDDDWDFQFDIDWNTNTVTWRVLDNN